MKSHNGFIDVDSIPGTGTTFTLYFPVCVEQYPSSSEPSTPPTMTGNKRILLVDDEPVIGEAIKEMLTPGWAFPWSAPGVEMKLLRW